MNESFVNFGVNTDVSERYLPKLLLIHLSPKLTCKEQPIIRLDYTSTRTMENLIRFVTKLLLYHGIVYLCVLSKLSRVECLTVDVTPQQATIHEGDSITLQCQATQVAVDGSISFTWFHQDGESNTVISTGGLVANPGKHHVTMMDTEDTSILRIADSKRVDAGPYTCVAMDGRSGENAQSSAEITILYKPAVHSPQCLVKDAIFHSLSDIQPGAKITMVCSSDVASPLPSISWYRTDIEQGNFVTGEIFVGEAFMRNEMTLTVSEEHQGATFECHLQSQAFPLLDQKCSLGPISVLGINQPNEVTTESNTRLRTDGKQHDNAKETFDGPVTTSSTSESQPDVSPCQRNPFHLADRAMVPTTIILALLLIVSVIFNCLQMSRVSQLSAKASSSSAPVAIRRQVVPEDGYMGINVDNRRPSNYTELNMTLRGLRDMNFDTEEDNASDYYGYTMPGFKSRYEDMSSANDLEDGRLSTVSKGTYEEMDDTGNPALTARPMSEMSRTTYEELADAHTPSSMNRMSSHNNNVIATSQKDVSIDGRSTHYENHENDENPVEPSIAGTLDYHSYERTISAMSGQLDGE